MPDTVKPYASRIRADGARRTRQLIRGAAARLFVEQGIAATTMRQVADAAGVAERTVYTAYPSKIALLRATLDVATVGDEEPVAVAQRANFEAVLSERDPARAAQQFVDLGIELLERAGDLLVTVSESSGADPAMREIVEEGSAAMTANMHALAAAWSRNGLLRAGQDPHRVAGVLYTLCGAHVHHLLRRRQGWTVEQYREWLVDTLLRTVLRP
ncbi:MAG: TetR/AcrR family transcriptional regulator [Pseudonocardia sp.]